MNTAVALEYRVDVSDRISERDAILMAAERVFAANGVSTASLEHIASEAGRSRHAVQRHFPSKQDLVIAYVRHWSDRCKREALEVRAANPRDPRAVLMECAALLHHPSGTDSGRSWVRVAADLAPGHPVRDAVLELRAWYAEFLAEELRELGHCDPSGTVSALLMFHTGAMTTGGGATEGDAAQARRLYALLIDG